MQKVIEAKSARLSDAKPTEDDGREASLIAFPALGFD